MSGGERAERRRRQQANRGSAAVSAARKSGRGTPWVLIAVAVVVVLAVGIGVGIFLKSRGAQQDQTGGLTPVQAGGDFPVIVQSSGIILAGDPAAPASVDIYEDYLCPGCGQFEDLYGHDIDRALADGRLTVRYHSVAILDEASDPPGYSTMAANAAICAAQAGIYPDFHRSLFANQPEEGAAGHPVADLVRLGTELGAGPTFAGCVRQGTHNAKVSALTQRAMQEAPKGPKGSFSTPTVTVDGRQVDLQNRDWLQGVLAGR